MLEWNAVEEENILIQSWQRKEKKGWRICSIGGSIHWQIRYESSFLSCVFLSHLSETLFDTKWCRVSIRVKYLRFVQDTTRQK